MAMLRKNAKSVGLMLSVALLAGACGPGVSRDGTYLTTSIRASDVALGALAKGDFFTAESYASRALVSDDRNPYALLAAALVYQGTDRPAEAIQTYQTILALNPGAKAILGQGSTLDAVPITEIARKNLEALKLLPESASMAQGQGATAIALQPTLTDSRTMANRILAGNLPQKTARARTEAPPTGVPAPSAPKASASRGGPAQAAMERLRILHGLYDGKLISREEFDARRMANLGAILPLTFPPPSDRALVPAPGPAEIAGRLNDLRTTLQKGGISQERFDAERTAILDALLPDHPTAWQPVAQPGTSEAARAAYTRRLQTLVATGLVTETEARRELAALSGPRAGGPPPTARSAAPVAPPTGATTTAPATPGGAPKQSMGIHLASYRSEGAARQGWADLQAKYPALLGTSQPVLRVVNKTGEGRFIRLLAGPVDSNVANNLCLALKSYGQYCSPEKL